MEIQPGVVNAAVNYTNATAQVEHIPTITSLQELKAALKSAGYDLVIDESEEAKGQLEELHRHKLIPSKRKQQVQFCFQYQQ